MKEKVRYIFVDLLRGWALLVMIEVHIFNVMLMPSLKETAWFTILNFINGLVAPSFLFISGFAFAISTRGKSDELRKFNYAFWKKIGRISLIILAGYSLHLPILSLRRLMNFYSREVIIKFYNVDILQCIGFGLLLLVLLRLVIKKEKIYNYVLLTLAVLVVVLTPLFWKVNFAGFMPIALANYFNTMNGSYFPLFPWLGFLLAGAITCKFYLDARENNRERNFVNLIMGAGVIIGLSGHFLLSDFVNLPSLSISPQPIFFFQRLGYVIFLLGLCWHYAELRQTKASFVLDVGRESLLVYWLHLQIIYRHFWNDISIATIFGGKFYPFQCIAATLMLALIMIGIAKLWRRIKTKHKTFAADFTLGLVGLCIVIFLIGF